VGHEEEKHLNFSSFYCLLFPFHKRTSMFAVLHSDINSLKSGLLHLTSQPYRKKSRSAKVKDGIINLILRNYLVDRYKCIHKVPPSHTSTVRNCNKDLFTFHFLSSISLNLNFVQLTNNKMVSANFIEVQRKILSS
jgi:hypothetical protein